METTVRRVKTASLVKICGAAGIVLLAAACHTHGDRPENERARAERAAVGGGEAKVSPAEEKASREAFLAVYPVFMHPRCVNCHPSGDAPLQGEDSHLHAQNVKRGTSGTGLPGLKCWTCHQDETVPGEGMPPGNKTWRLPGEGDPLVFQGLSARELAAQLKDSRRNGGRTLAQVERHVAEDDLVRSCWSQGPGRPAPPLAHDEFAKRFKEWVDKGAALPE